MNQTRKGQSTLFLVHGRGVKPEAGALEAQWCRALNHGLARDHKASLESVHVEMLYYGDLTNDLMNPPYSMIIEYEIDESRMTARQKWGFGQGDDRYYGSFTCGVNLFANGNKMMMVLAALKPGMAPTTRPSRMAGRNTYQNVNVRANSSMKTPA